MDKPYWIKERHNPQLGTYWVPMGQMSKTAAKKCERPLYGENIMHRFDSKEEYDPRLGKFANFYHREMRISILVGTPMLVLRCSCGKHRVITPKAGKIYQLCGRKLKIGNDYVYESPSGSGVERPLKV